MDAGEDGLSSKPSIPLSSSKAKSKIVKAEGVECDSVSDKQEVEGAEGEEAEDSGGEGTSNAAALEGRPKRSTRGKPPRALSPGDDDAGSRRGGTTTPVKASRVMGSPTSTKTRSRQLPPDTPDSSRKRAGKQSDMVVVVAMVGCSCCFTALAWVSM